MKNAMQLKAIMKKLAKENQISAQLVLQNYMLERFLERVSLSPYRDNYIIKGGFLISSMVGLNSRATMDMDATIKGYPVTQDAVQKMIEQILTVPVDDDITFTFKSIGEIREGDEYTGYRVALTADFPPMAVPLKLDITTGDKITPREIQYDYKLMLEDRHIQVMAYNLATILAEKLETVISRSDQNTRPRDYYDVYILTKLQAENIDFPALGAALMATASKRGSDSILQDYRAIVEAVRNSEIMRRQWDNYRKDFDYASTISFDEACDAVASTMDTLITNNYNKFTFNFSRETYSIPEKLVKFFNVTKTTDNTMNFLKNVDGLYDFYTESDKNVDGSIKALKNVTGIGKNSKVFSIFDKYGTKTVKTIEDVVGLIGG